MLRNDANLKNVTQLIKPVHIATVSIIQMAAAKDILAEEANSLWKLIRTDVQPEFDNFLNRLKISKLNVLSGYNTNEAKFKAGSLFIRSKQEGLRVM